MIWLGFTAGTAQIPIFCFFLIQASLLLCDVSRRGPQVLMGPTYVFDNIRLTVMVVYLVYGMINKGEIQTQTYLLSILVLVSWLTILFKYLRYFGGLRKLLPLIPASFAALWYFAIIMIVVMVGFTFALRIKYDYGPQENHFG